MALEDPTLPLLSFLPKVFCIVFSAVAKLPKLSPSCEGGLRCCRKAPSVVRRAMKKAFSAVARFPVLSHSCEESLQCCRKALRVVVNL